ncbi:late competence development ComFB family protein [Candidatus Avoscillospira sp. LCP25S3_F1]|uniref:late competence development ComFB family protein n=1 Tax=Candidatus Avoscillospira sp. LCP25S3_F1 TaxID=3438825 RepID=UPI003F9332F0
MATKKSNRSSKTDHVLSLLSNSSAPEPPTEDVPAAEAPSGEPPVKVAAPAAEVPTGGAQRLSPPILEVARTNNEALEATIQQALEAALEEDIPAPSAPEAMPPQAPIAPTETVSVPVSESVPDLSAMSEPASTEVPEPVAESVPQPVSEPVAERIPEPTPAAVSAAEPTPVSVSVPEPDTVASIVPSDPEAAATRQILPDGSRMINVMEYLVSQKVEYYARMFHLCCCPRCLADSMALALSRLPAKYVVLPEQSYRPMLSFLEAKFDSMVTAQVIYACKQVLEVPRHNL